MSAIGSVQPKELGREGDAREAQLFAGVTPEDLGHLGLGAAVGVGTVGGVDLDGSQLARELVAAEPHDASAAVAEFVKNAEATATAEAISQLDGVKSATDVVADALDSNCVVGEVIREWLVIVFVILVLVLVLVLVCFGCVDFSCRVDIKVAHFVVNDQP